MVLGSTEPLSTNYLHLSGYAGGMKHISILLVILVTPALAAELNGPAHIVDGDTLHLNGTKIRLHGIDAPETRQECQDKDDASYLCGEASTAALRTLIGSQPVRCEGSTHDRYGRPIGVCYATYSKISGWREICLRE